MQNLRGPTTSSLSAVDRIRVLTIGILESVAKSAHHSKDADLVQLCKELGAFANDLSAHVHEEDEEELVAESVGMLGSYIRVLSDLAAFIARPPPGRRISRLLRRDYGAQKFRKQIVAAGLDEFEMPDPDADPIETALVKLQVGGSDSDASYWASRSRSQSASPRASVEACASISIPDSRSSLGSKGNALRGRTLTESSVATAVEQPMTQTPTPPPDEEVTWESLQRRPVAGYGYGYSATAPAPVSGYGNLVGTHVSGNGRLMMPVLGGSGNKFDQLTFSS
ncbi:hypothetical protein MKEN_00943200 [Mycena kentingensis (nom. inval.)]|nr:hypothetical protein MKEN_00943200 [Mycena kentingensis (nom. inval.)]